MAFFDIFKKKQDNSAAQASEERKQQQEELNAGLEKTKTGLFSKLARAVAGRSTVDADVLDDLEAFFTKVERMPPVEINEMLIRTDWNNSIHVDENYNRVQDIIRQFKGRCTEISCHIGEKQFFLNPEDNGNINEAEF